MIQAGQYQPLLSVKSRSFIDYLISHSSGILNGIHIAVAYNVTKKEDAYSRTGGIFIRDTARDTAYLL